MLSAERGTIIKPHGGRTSVALLYPNTYYVGMSSLGFQTVYRLINLRRGALAERAFLPTPAEKDEHYKTRTPLFTLESRTKVADFEIVAFSASFENDYINIAEMFKLSGLPPMSESRGENFPLVILGGITTFFNPEPIADFFDAVLVGEAEGLLDEFLDAYERHKRLHKTALLSELAKIPGVYIPKFYKPVYKEDGTLGAFEPSPGALLKVKRRYLEDLDLNPASSAIITPNTEFGEMFMVELARGCGRHCRFCMAGYLYRPPRARGLDSALADIKTGSKLTRRIGLVGAAVSDYQDIAELAAALSGMDVDVSASSLRADSLTPELAALVANGNRTVAIAPEAGSERLRGVINKNITEEQILGAVRTLINAGILNVKLYFMVGLPTETDADVEAIVALAKKARDEMVASAKGKGRLGTLTLSINCFIPKPWTPMQWDAMEPVERLQDKIRRIKKLLKGIPNLSVIHDVPKWAYLQAALSRGDRRLSRVILSASENDGNWKAAFKEAGLSQEFFAGRVREKDDLFPWDFIDTGIDKDYLRQEHGRGERACHTPPCKVGTCRLCGVC